jgi:hypothetical protein
MKISLLGDIIDTDNIYQVTPIWAQELIFCVEKDGAVGNVGFTIKFFNQKKIDIIKDSGAWSDYEKAKVAGEERLQQVTKLREELIKIWSNNQSSIPKLEFES